MATKGGTNIDYVDREWVEALNGGVELEGTVLVSVDVRGREGGG